MKKHIAPEIIDTRTNKNFLCLLEDAKLMLNMLEQAQRGFIMADTDYVQPGICAGQTKMDVVEVTLESMQNHIKYFRKRNEFFQ